MTRTEYQLMDINFGDTNDAGSLATLLDPETGETLDDLRIPGDSEYAPIRDALKAGTGDKDLYVTVLAAMGTRKILPVYTQK